MLKQNQEAQRRYRKRLKLKAAARDAELDSMRSKLESAEGLAVQLFHLQRELEKKNHQMILLQDAVKRRDLAGAGGVDLLSAVCKMNSDVTEFICKLQDQLQCRTVRNPSGIPVPPGPHDLPSILSELGTTFDELVRMVSCLDGSWGSLTASARVLMNFEHPSEQSSWYTAAVEALLSHEQVAEIHELYKQSILGMEPILQARQSITNALLGLRAGWNNTVSLTAEVAQQGGEASLLELSANDITMLLSIAHSTQQKFSEMVKNIMQDTRLEANMNATLLNKILNDSQVAKIITLTRNRMPSVLKLGLVLDKMGAFDPLNGSRL